MPERLFCKYLQHKKYLYRAPAGNLMPYAGPFRRGLFIVRDFYNRDTGFFGCYTCSPRLEKMSCAGSWPRLRDGRGKIASLPTE